ncbi:MAG: DNA gyrase subunit A, partial [Rhodospirillaceae bacterium]
MSSTIPPPAFDITPVTIEEEMKRSYLDYAMSVIVSRALPDVRDGLKPVHRRILFAMKEGGYDYNRPFRKSARIVGEVMGKYHPHGDSAIYDAMVRMAQGFSMRLPLIGGQGNFGSMDGDPPAAMRYTEARLARAAHVLLDDIDKDTVDFQPSYDETNKEPVVLPARFPNLLVNGAGGIAVGMATNIPPHNLGEVIDACCAYIDDPAISVEALIALVPAPDFPTGGIILGREGARAAYVSGRGSIIVRGRCHKEELRKDRDVIVITEVPYQVNKARMIEIMAELVRDKRIEGIADLRDESDRRGLRVVVEVKRDANAEVVLNQLYRFTPLQTSFGVNALALNGGRPEMVTLKGIVATFVTFRKEVIRRRTIFELNRAREKAHILISLAVALANLDEVITLIRTAPDPQAARERLMVRAWQTQEVESLIRLIDEPDHLVTESHYHLSETQARAILELRLHRLTGLERKQLHADLRDFASQIEEYLHILSSREHLSAILRQELVQIKNDFGTPRRTTIEDSVSEQDVEDLIQREDMVVTATSTGYIKRVPLSTYRAQRRGGKGRTGMVTKEADCVSHVLVANTHAPVLFFSSAGIAYRLKVYRLPEGTPQSRGKAMVNILPLEEGQAISAVLPLPEDERIWCTLHVMFATASGHVRRNLLSDFANVMANGKIAMKLDAGDSLIGVLTCTETDDILLATRHGKCIRFPVTDVRVFAGRTSTGVRGIRLTEGDTVISVSVVRHDDTSLEQRYTYLKLRRNGETGGETEDGETTAGEGVLLFEDDYNRMKAGEEFILTVTEHGFGKRTSSYEYRITNRGGQGIVNIET